MSNFITKSDLTDYAPDLDLSQFSDTTISGMIGRATQRAANMCGVTGFDLQNVVGEEDQAAITSDGDLVISARRRPIQSVSAIRLTKGGFSIALTLFNGTQPLFQSPYPGNIVVYPNNYLAGTGTLAMGGNSQLISMKGAKVDYQMDYLGGYQVIPDDLKEAITLLVRDIVNTRNNSTGAASFSQGSLSESYEQGKPSRLFMAAKDILADGDYVRMVV